MLKAKTKESGKEEQCFGIRVNFKPVIAEVVFEKNSKKSGAMRGSMCGTYRKKTSRK